MGLLIGMSIALVALTLCVAIAVLSYRLWHAKQGVATGASSDGQIALLAGSIALFGVLISGIFLFTTFRIDEGAHRAASETARERAKPAAARRNAEPADSGTVAYSSGRQACSRSRRSGITGTMKVGARAACESSTRISRLRHTAT